MRNRLIILILMVLLMTGCRQQSAEVTLPKTLELQAELPQEYPKKATVYQVGWNEIDGDRAAQTLLINDVTDCSDTYEDIDYDTNEVDSREGMSVFRRYRESGLSYQYETDLDWVGYSGFNLPIYEPIEKYAEPDASQQMYGNLDLLAYASSGDLGFMKQEDALAEIEIKMRACGFSDWKLRDVQVMDADTMNQNLEIYNQATSEMNEWTEGLVEQGLWEEPIIMEIVDYTFTEADERYVFHFRQVQDGIPFADVIWMQMTRDVCTEPIIEAVYSSRNGLETLWAENMYIIEDAVKETPIISPEEALKVYVDEYSQAIHFENTSITQMELCYIVVVDGNVMYAKPAWILSLYTEREAIEEWNHDWIEFQHFAINAETGVILQGEQDLR